MTEVAPSLVMMAVLLAGSAFCSGSEAALFYLTPGERLAMRAGTRAERRAESLLADSERLLFTVLFCNLLINIAYFALASAVGLRLETLGLFDQPGIAATVTAVAALAVIILLGEMLPKTFAVLKARTLAAMVAAPMSVLTRILGQLSPVFRVINIASVRLIWPSFRGEPSVELGDLERAIHLSTAETSDVPQERAYLSNLVLLSDLRVEEWMRPRGQLRIFRPPVSLSDLIGEMPPTDYLCFTSPESDDIERVLFLPDVLSLPEENLERVAGPVEVIPWCASVIDAYARMRRKDREAVIVNEFGETIGLLTFEDIFDTVLRATPSRNAILHGRHAVERTAEGWYRVAGVTSLRRLEKALPGFTSESRVVTLAGAVQEELGRLPREGDTCRLGDYAVEVVDVPRRGEIIVIMRPDLAMAEDR